MPIYGSSGSWCPRSISQPMRDKRWWINAQQHLHPQKDNTGVSLPADLQWEESQLPVVATHSLKYFFFFFNFSLLFVSLLHSAMLRSSSWDHLPNKSFESKSLGSPFGRPHIKVIHSSDSKIQLKMHTFQGSSWLSCMIWICVVSCHFHRIAPACTFCTYFRLESIFSLPGISLPLLWWYSAIHLTGLNKKSELIELLTS